jgi:hypothetical protein
MFTKYYKYGNQLNSHNLLKFAAIFLMAVDHIGRYIFPEQEWLRLLGRFSAPIFLFLVGYSLNYKSKKDIFFWAGLLIIYTGLINHQIFPLNILVTIILARLFLSWADKREYLQTQILVILLVLVIWWALTFFIFDYGTQGFTFAVCGYLVAKGWHNMQTKIFFVAIIVFYIATQRAFMEFNIVQILVLTLGICTLFWYFYNYKLTTYKYSGLLKSPVIFVSRYSLEFYVIHLIILQGISAFVIDADKYQTFKWID